MATKKVNIDIVAKDRSSRVLKGVKGQLDKVKKSVFNLRNAFIGLGVGLVARDFIKTASEIENLQVRFKFLFNTVEEGQQAFQGLVDFAAKVPFQLSEIQAGAANLAVVSESAKEMNELLELTGDIAASAGLDFKTTAEQMMRVWSAGISSADLFRERGVGNMLGFEQGVRYSAEESKKHILDAFRSGTLEVKGASGELAQTFSGTMSMIQDKYLKFKLVVMDAAPFDFLKGSFSVINKNIEDNFGSIEKFGASVGEELVIIMKKMLGFAAVTLDAMRMPLQFVSNAFGNFIKLFNSLPKSIQAFGLIGAILLGKRAFVIIAAIEGLRLTLGFINKQMQKLNESMDTADFESELDAINRKWIEQQEAIEKTKKEVIDYNNILAVDTSALSGFMKDYIGFLQEIETEINAMRKARNESNESVNEDEKKSNDKSLNQQQKYWDKYTKEMSKRLQAERRMKRESKEQLIELEKLGNQQIFDNTRESLSALSGLNRGAFEAYKRFQIAEATINAIMSASTAFKTYAATPLMAYAVAASSLAKGMAMVAQIQSLSYREHGGAVQRGKPYIVGEAGREMFVPNQSGNIIPNDQLGGAVNVNFNINTVDARGFNELLTNSRATIVGMINSAVNETGRQAII